MNGKEVQLSGVLDRQQRLRFPRLMMEIGDK